MAEVPSTRTLPLGSLAPEFTLTDFEGRSVTLNDVRGEKGLVVAFVCNHCPFVVHLAQEMGMMVGVLEKQGVGFVAINSNDIERYPQDGPDKMVEFARANGWTFPYLLDEDQSVAKNYDAACTPDFYVFDEKLQLTYCGQFDDSRPRNGKPVTGHDLRRATDAVLLGLPPLSPQQPSSGCSIKWKLAQ